MFSRDPADNHYKLSDFEIMNMIGKGSISNVFLLKKKSTGEAFAMKSIRKDLVLEGDLMNSTKLEKDILLTVRRVTFLCLLFIIANCIIFIGNKSVLC